MKKKMSANCLNTLRNGGYEPIKLAFSRPTIQVKIEKYEPPLESSEIIRFLYITPRSAVGLRSVRTGSYLQMNRLSLRNNRLKLTTARKLPIVLEEFIEYTPIQ